MFCAPAPARPRSWRTFQGSGRPPMPWRDESSIPSRRTSPRDACAPRTETPPGGIPQFTPVNLITGFLGSGKTTLLKRMLASPALADTAVLINEFGEVGLDHELLEQLDDNTVLLQSGCLCCTIRGDLADAIRHLDS